MAYISIRIPNINLKYFIHTLECIIGCCSKTQFPKRWGIILIHIFFTRHFQALCHRIADDSLTSNKSPDSFSDQKEILRIYCIRSVANGDLQIKFRLPRKGCKFQIPRRIVTVGIVDHTAYSKESMAASEKGRNWILVPRSISELLREFLSYC